MAIKIVVLYLEGQTDSHSSLKKIFKLEAPNFLLKVGKFQSTCNSELRRRLLLSVQDAVHDV